MSRVRIASFSISLDGFGAGPHQSLEQPLGVGFMAAQEWVFATRTFQHLVLGADGGETGVDDGFMARGFQDVGAWILGRNMFAPTRGPWLDDGWKGWWGEEPPYHTPVFVLTHHARAPLEMKGGTVFHFVTGGIEAALAQARAAAKGQDVRIGGGVSTLQQYLRAGLVDEVNLAVFPVFIGAGERLFDGLDLPALGYGISQVVAGERATHVVLTKR
ncbi:MAG: dihydrofolate reductase family protein [Gemmatimonadaceae bacterium]|nr:dihydrofolate reductase family protein [Gemmatimonadaceae bacterium]